MGFWARLFGREKPILEKYNLGDFTPKQQDNKGESLNIESRKEVNVPRHPIKRNKETSAYVESIRKKAFSQDIKPRPHLDTQNHKKIEEITKRIREKL